MEGRIYELPSEDYPIFVGVDMGEEDFATECEVKIYPDGVIEVIDIRQIPRASNRPK